MNKSLQLQSNCHYILQLANLEKIHSERLNALKSTEEELAALQEEYAKVKQYLNAKILKLAPLDKELRVSSYLMIN